MCPPPWQLLHLMCPSRGVAKTFCTHERKNSKSTGGGGGGT